MRPVFHPAVVRYDILDGVRIDLFVVITLRIIVIVDEDNVCVVVACSHIQKTHNVVNIALTSRWSSVIMMLSSVTQMVLVKYDVGQDAFSGRPTRHLEF